MLLAFAFIGRAAISADGAEMLSEALGLFVQGRFEMANPPPGPPHPGETLFVSPPFQSRYGLFPSLLHVPMLAVVWPVRSLLGPSGLDMAVGVTWALGAGLAALAFRALVRRLVPGASGFWAPAFLAGTYLFPYAADSFVEPFCAAGLAAGAALALAETLSPRRAALAALAWCSAALLKPVLWLLAPILILGILLRSGSERERVRCALVALGAETALLALALAVNVMRSGSAAEAGYGSQMFAFTTPFFTGLFGLLVSPGRGLLFFAPVLLAAVLGVRRLSPAALPLLPGAGLLLVFVMARWWGWNGGSAWGPRLVLPVLPLLVAPAVLAPRKLAAGLLGLGMLLNLPGVLVAPGVWCAYTEFLVPPPGSSWPRSGPDRVSDVASLTPLYGHWWLLTQGKAPWLEAGAREAGPRMRPADFISPLWLRTAMGLPRLWPVVPHLLVKSAYAYEARGRPESARRWAEEALVLSPSDPNARRLLGRPRPGHGRP